LQQEPVDDIGTTRGSTVIAIKYARAAGMHWRRWSRDRRYRQIESRTGLSILEHNYIERTAAEEQTLLNNPLLRRFPESPSNDELKAAIEEFTKAANMQGPHAWLYLLCRSFCIAFLDFSNASPQVIVPRKQKLTRDFSALSQAAHTAILEGSTSRLIEAANGITRLNCEVL
jgi:hypothetical protein